VKFTGNSAIFAGAIYLHDSTNVTFNNSTIVFENNTALQNGGVLYAIDNCYISITGNSMIKFINNKASRIGGTIFCDSNSSLTLEDNSSMIFSRNKAVFGGAIRVSENSFIFFKDSSVAIIVLLKCLVVVFLLQKIHVLFLKESPK